MSLSTEQMSRGVVFRGKRRKIKIGTLRNFSFWGLRKVFWLKAAQKKKTHCWLMSPYMSEGGRHSTRCPTFFVLDRQISCESSSSRRLWNTGSRGLSGGINETPITQSKGKVFFLVCRAGNKQDKNSTSIWSVWSGSPLLCRERTSLVFLLVSLFHCWLLLNGACSSTLLAGIQTAIIDSIISLKIRENVIKFLQN